MTKLPRFLMLLLSITTGLITLIIGGMLINQHTTLAFSAFQPAEQLFDPFLTYRSKLPVPEGPNFPDNKPTSPPSAKLIPIVSTKPVISQSTPEWMTYDGLDLSSSELKVSILLSCENKAIVLPGFTNHAWYPGVFEDGTFDVSANSAITWEHLGYYGLWMHSGQDLLGRKLTAFNLHDYLERNSQGVLRSPEDFEKNLQECLIGSIVRLDSGGKTSLSRITAGVRVPNKQVNALSEHVMDLVPYLAERYPESGFTDLKTPALLFYFCSRRLVGETEDPNSFFYAQARIIIAMEPIPDDYFK